MPEQNTLEVDSNFPHADDPHLDIEVSGIIKALGIAQNSEEEFLNTMEQGLVSAINQDASLATSTEAKQLALTKKKLQLYQKTKENIQKEISRLLAISDSKNLSPENATQINRLISNMHSLEDRIAFYTKQDQTLRKAQKQREQQMIARDQKKKLAEKIKQQKKDLAKAQNNVDKKDLMSFFLPGKWLKIYREDQQRKFHEQIENIEKAEAQLKELEKKTQSQSTKPPLVQQKNTVAQSSTRSTSDPSRKHALPQAAKLKPKPPEMFAELFEHPVIKGNAARGPDSQSGKIMRTAEQNRNTQFTKQTTEIQKLTQRSNSPTIKKQK